jgi:hypothetical protein
LGKSVKVNDLNFPGIQLLDSPNTVIASVKLTRAARGITVEEEAAEAEAEAAAEAAEKLKMLPLKVALTILRRRVNTVF